MLLRRAVIALSCLLFALAQPAHTAAAAMGQPSSGLTITAPEVNGASDPLGIDDSTPRFTWRLASDRRGVMQTSYRVLVASRPELLSQGTGDVWDSGPVASAEPWATYAGPALRSRARYVWSVRVTATPAGITASSPPAWFETAFLQASEWQGQWIAGPERSHVSTPVEGEADDAIIRAAGEFCRPVGWLTSGFAAKVVANNQGECRDVRPAPLLRKSVALARPVARARVYSAGLAYNHLTINGTPTSDSVLDPAFTDYSKTVLYTTHDVTSLMRPGENVVAAELGSGQFDSATRTWDWGWDQAEWRATPQLLLQLHVTFDDGSELVVASDSSWKVSTAGPRRYDSYYLGETYDARREIAGWDRPGFADASWAAARVVRPPAGTLRAQAHEPIAVVSERQPSVRFEPAPGVFVYDIGQNLTGWAIVTVEAPAGTAIELFYSEKRAADGRASTIGNDLVFGQLQTDYYVASGKGQETWAPRFTYKGFQYVQVSAPGGQPLPPGVTVTVQRIQQIRSALARTSSFETDHPTLNRIHQNTVWAIQSNLHGVVTDTPVYEKNAWTGDAQLTAGTASVLFDTERLYTKLFQDMRDAQTDQGEVPLLAPSNEHYGYVGKPAFKPVDCCGATPAWDAFWFVIPWESYLRYGDREALERTYPEMQRYLDEWIPRWTDKDGDTHAHTLTAGLGDWVPPEGVPTVNALASSAYHAHLARIASDVARELGRPDDAARYAQLVERVRADVNARFLGADGVYREKPGDGFVQTAQILPLAFGIVPDAVRAPLVATLARDITHARGGNPFVGVLGARYVLPVLTAAGRHDLACTVATQVDEPSWGYWTDAAGFSALGEHWTAETRSRNHHMFGSIVQWFYEDLAGIRPVDAGYRTVEIRPGIPPDGIRFVSASYDSIRGTIGTRWRRTEAGLELDVVVPANARARVYVPGSDGGSVSETGSGRRVPASTAEGVTFIGVADGRVVYEVGSGRYEFRVP
jgi:alpha-L-rhamnosidase